jgi:Tfp pilus assembly protein PilV
MPSNSVPNKKIRANSGWGILEIVVGVAILSGALLVLIGLFANLLRLSATNLRQVQAGLLAQEGVEAVRLFRDTAWANVANLTPGKSYALYFTGSAWATSTTPVLVNGLFDRRVVVSGVCRNANSDIAACGTNDPDAKYVTVSVAWRVGAATTTRAISFYTFNLFES